jgi:hypothetical protein
MIFRLSPIQRVVPAVQPELGVHLLMLGVTLVILGAVLAMLGVTLAILGVRLVELCGSGHFFSSWKPKLQAQKLRADRALSEALCNAAR